MNRRAFITPFDALVRRQFLVLTSLARTRSLAEINDQDRSSLLAWSRSRSCGTARLALEDNGHEFVGPAMDLPPRET